MLRCRSASFWLVVRERGDPHCVPPSCALPERRDTGRHNVTRPSAPADHDPPIYAITMAGTGKQGCSYGLSADVALDQADDGFKERMVTSSSHRARDVD